MNEKLIFCSIQYRKKRKKEQHVKLTYKKRIQRRKFFFIAK